MSPYRSKAQARKFHAMLKRGEISKKTVEEFDESTDFEGLPNKVRSKRVTKRNHKKGSRVLGSG